METKALSDGIGCEGCVAVHYADGVLAKVVTSDANRTAYRVRSVDNTVVEEPLEAVLLR